MTTCTHPGEKCEGNRYCSEPGCTYGLIMWGFLCDDDSYCPFHFSLTEEDVENNDDVYYSDWQPEDYCYDCEEGCPCMDEAKTMLDSNRQELEEAIILVPDSYRYAVPIHGSFTPAIYIVTAMGYKDAKSIIGSFPHLQSGEDWRIKLVEGPAEVPHEDIPGRGFLTWPGRHEFFHATLLDKIETF